MNKLEIDDLQVGEDIILALGWASKAAKWTLTMAAFCAGVWHAIKFAIKAATP